MGELAVRIPSKEAGIDANLPPPLHEARWLIRAGGDIIAFAI